MSASDNEELYNYIIRVSTLMRKYRDVVEEAAHTYTAKEMSEFIRETMDRVEDTALLADVVCELCNLAGEWCEAHKAPLTDFYGLLQGDEVFSSSSGRGLYMGVRNED